MWLKLGTLISKGSGKVNSCFFLRKLLFSFSGPGWVQKIKSEISLFPFLSRGEASVLRKAKSKNYWEQLIQGHRIKSALKLTLLWACSYMSQHISYCFSQLELVFLVLADKDIWNFHFIILEVFIYANLSSVLIRHAVEEVIRVIYPQCVHLVWNLRSGENINYEVVM